MVEMEIQFVSWCIIAFAQMMDVLLQTLA